MGNIGDGVICQDKQVICWNGEALVSAPKRVNSGPFGCKSADFSDIACQ